MEMKKEKESEKKKDDRFSFVFFQQNDDILKFITLVESDVNQRISIEETEVSFLPFGSNCREQKRSFFHFL